MWRQGEILKSEVGGVRQRCEDRRGETWKRRMSWESRCWSWGEAKEMWRTAEEKAKSFEQNHDLSLHGQGVYLEMPRPTRYLFFQSVAWAEGPARAKLPVRLPDCVSARCTTWSDDHGLE
jgi:hypothetical protein